MHPQHQYDISIGDNVWIACRPITRRLEEATSIDPLLVPMESFWARLEVGALTGCCGIDAFALWPEDIRGASRELRDELLRSKLEALKAFVTESGADDFVSMRLNHRFRRDALLQLLEHVARHI